MEVIDMDTIALLSRALGQRSSTQKSPTHNGRMLPLSSPVSSFLYTYTSSFCFLSLPFTASTRELIGCLDTQFHE